MFYLVPSKELRAASIASMQLELHEVVLCKFHCEMIRMAPRTGHSELSYDHRVMSRIARGPVSPGVVVVESTIRVLAKGRFDQKGQGVQPAFQLNAKFGLLYQVPKGWKPDAAQLRAFAKINGVYNAWPFFRELVSTASARMGYPSLILPTIVVRPRPAGKRQAHHGRENKPQR